MYKIKNFSVSERLADIILGVGFTVVLIWALRFYFEETCPQIRLGVSPPQETKEYLQERGFVPAKVVTVPIIHKDRPAETTVETEGGVEIRAHIENPKVAQVLAPGDILYVRPDTHIAWKYYH